MDLTRRDLRLVVIALLFACTLIVRVGAFSSLRVAPPIAASSLHRKSCGGSDYSRQQSSVQSSKVRRLNTAIASSTAAIPDEATDLPDSLEDAAEIAALACVDFAESVSGFASAQRRCRVDFDTTIGDETYTLQQASTEFMQQFTSALCYGMIPGAIQEANERMKRVSEAQAELRDVLGDEQEGEDATVTERRDFLISVVQSGGVAKSSSEEEGVENDGWTGPTCRVYFPDEGSAALARRDWKGDGATKPPVVPSCVDFSASGGVRTQDTSRDSIAIFYCPQASEAVQVEELLLKMEEERGDGLQLTIFVNPNLVDMGVTGFGMAGRYLRERLLDPLQQTYYLRTLPWGALTRVWPKSFSVWQEDVEADGGYRLISMLDRLPSNPEVMDIYDIENGLKEKKNEEGGFGILNAIGDFVQGMSKL